MERTEGVSYYQYFTDYKPVQYLVTTRTEDCEGGQES